MNAKKRSGNKTSNYIITSKEANYDRKSSHYIGKLRSNYGKSEYTIYNNGENWFKNKNLKRNDIRDELGCIFYKQNTKDESRGFIAYIPEIDNDGNKYEFKPKEKDQTM